MEYVFALFLLTFGQIDVDQYEHRFGDRSVQKVQKTFPAVYQATQKVDIPPRYLIGVIYNETNATPDAMGDGGWSYGLGQIRCRVWRHWLREEGMVHLQSCNQLLRPYTNVLAIAKILKFLEQKGGSWDNALEAYHTGQYSQDPSYDRAYKERVYYFADVFLPYYQAYVKIRPGIESLESFFDRWSDLMRHL